MSSFPYRYLVWISVILVVLIDPIYGQWGLGKKRGGSTFEELQDIAKKQLGGAKDNKQRNPATASTLLKRPVIPPKKDTDSGSDYDDDDNTVEEWSRFLQEALDDPATMKYMEQMNENMGSVLDQLSHLSPKQIQEQIAQGLQQITEPSVLENILQQQDLVLSTLVQQGLVTPEKAAEYKKHPELFEQEIASAFDQMKQIFADPDALNAAMQMMKGFGDVMKGGDTTDVLKKLTKSVVDTVSDALEDDDTIEKARLQLLQNPAAAGNPALASLLKDPEMQSILNDPVKWREQVKKGQEMLMADVDTSRDEL